MQPNHVVVCRHLLEPDLSRGEAEEKGSGHMQITNNVMEMAYLKMRSVSPAIRYNISLSLASFPGRVGGEKTSSLPRGLGMRLHYPRPSYPRVFDNS